MQYHYGNTHQGMVWPPIYWTHVFQTSSQEVLKMQPITDEFKEAFLHNKHNSNVMSVEDTIMDTAAEASIDENWWLIDNQ